MTFPWTEFLNWNSLKIRSSTFSHAIIIFQNATFSNLFMGHFFQKIYYLDINAQLIVMNNSSKNDFVNRKFFFSFLKQL